MAKLIRKKDLIIIVFLVLIVIITMMLNSHDSGDIVRITINNEVYGQYDLHKNQTINIHDENIIVIQDNEVYMKEANCPDKLCVNQGNIDISGESIICLPHQLVVEIVSDDDKGVDGIAS